MNEIDNTSLNECIDKLSKAIGNQNIWSLFSAYSLLGFLISAISGVVLGYIFTNVIESKVNTFLHRFIPRIFRKSDSLSGQWLQTIHINSPNYHPQSSSQVRLKHRRNTVSGKFQITNIHNEKLEYYLYGRVKDNRYIEGEWFNTNDGHRYFGTFLFSIGVNMKTLSGQWVGSTSTNKVNSGNWQWQKI